MFTRRCNTSGEKKELAPVRSTGRERGHTQNHLVKSGQANTTDDGHRRETKKNGQSDVTARGER